MKAGKFFTLLFLFVLIMSPDQMKARNDFRSILVFPEDSLFNKLTDMDRQVKDHIAKDTLRGYSTPRKIEATTFFTAETQKSSAQRDRKGLIVVPFDYDPFLSYMNFSDTVIFDPVMLPVVFDGKILSPDLDFRSKSHILKRNSLKHILVDRDSIVSPFLYRYNDDSKHRYKLINQNNTLSSNLLENERINTTRRKYYTKNPQYIKSNALAYGTSPTIKKDIERRNPFQELISTNDAIQIAGPSVTKLEVKQVFWKTSGQHELKISQKAYSHNWAPATDDNFQIQNYHKFDATFRKGKIEFKHWIEWRFNAQYTRLPDLEHKEGEEKPKDIRKKFLINDDWVRTYNKLGLDAFIKKWSYIFTLDMKTPLFVKNPQNDKHKKLAALFSPLDVNFGVGAGYTLEKKSTKVKDRVFKLTIDATPFSLDMRYVANDSVWYKGNKYGVVYEDLPEDKDKKKEDRKSAQRRYSKTEFGSTINTTIFYALNSYTNFNTRLKYFTNYERVYLECENTINFQLNRYLATSLYVYMKFDDSVDRETKRSKKWGYFSFNEVLGFGLSYRW